MATLIINDYEDYRIYKVIVFPTPMARFRAIEVIDNVRRDLAGEWTTEDMWDALAESDIEYEMLDDVEEFRI